MPQVTIESGTLEGAQHEGIYAFKGVPFGRPFNARTRWQKPIAADKWDGVLPALEYGRLAPQAASATPLPWPRSRRRYYDAVRGYPMAQGLDCLRLNVWTPTLDQAEKRPVMVYIHGGGFATGGAMHIYDGTRFAEKGAVCVAIQYRLGALGFLHGEGLFEDGLCDDNRGFLDMLLALEWVQQNIAAFGGDPANVTLFGESAGGFAVFQLAASPLARGLFRRAIPMGSMAETCAPQADYHKLTKDVLAAADVTVGDGSALENVSDKQIKKIHREISRRIFGKQAASYGELGKMRVGFLGAATGTAFQPEPPLAAFAKGRAAPFDLMAGTCANDGGLFSLLTPIGKKVSAKLFSGKLDAYFPAGGIKQLVSAYQAALPGESNVYERINNDLFYKHPTRRAVAAHASGGLGASYLYEVQYSSALKGLGAIHGIEVALLFKAATANGLLHDDEETRALADAMVEAWVNFAASGSPTAKGLPDWPAFSDDAPYRMQFDRQSVCALIPQEQSI